MQGGLRQLVAHLQREVQGARHASRWAAGKSAALAQLCGVGPVYSRRCLLPFTLKASSLGSPPAISSVRQGPMYGCLAHCGAQGRQRQRVFDSQPGACVGAACVAHSLSAGAPARTATIGRVCRKNWLQMRASASAAPDAAALLGLNAMARCRGGGRGGETRHSARWAFCWRRSHGCSRAAGGGAWNQAYETCKAST